MADFFSAGWSFYIAIITIVSIVFCVWLALAMARAKDTSGAGAKAGTTGHRWDEDLEEYNNPLPRWWLGLYLLTCAFGVIYLILYPGLGSFAGVLGWTQNNQYEKEVDRVNAQVEPLFAKYMGQDIPTLAADPQARDMGERLYLTYCTQCHGATAQGSRGFPNLTDGEWMWGGDPEQIKTTIAQGRMGVMPPQSAAVGSSDDVTNVAHYVLSLSDSGHDPARAALGKDKYAVCSACHGAEGKGNPLLGAPDLTNKTWLYGGGLNTIAEGITKGRTNQMPPFGDLLGEGKIHVLAAYIWGLSNRTETANR